MKVKLIALTLLLTSLSIGSQLSLPNVRTITNYENLSQVTHSRCLRSNETQEYK